MTDEETQLQKRTSFWSPQPNTPEDIKARFDLALKCSKAGCCGLCGKVSPVEPLPGVASVLRCINMSGCSWPPERVITQWGTQGL